MGGVSNREGPGPDRLLGPALERGRSPIRTLAIIGFGRVGRTFARRLEAEDGWSGTRRWKVVAALDSGGACLGAEGIDLPAAIERKERSGRIEDQDGCRATVGEALRGTRPDVVIELTRGGPVDGEPGTQHILDALSLGADVITANKSPLALYYPEIRDEARCAEREVRFGATVGGVVPILEASAGLLPAAGTLRVEAIMNGTTQFVLGKLSRGVSYDETIAEARALGITESDPQSDLGGNDARLKAAILHHVLFGVGLSPEEIPVDSVTYATADVARQASARGLRLVSVAEITPAGAQIRLRKVPRGSRWDAPGFQNLFRVETRSAGTLWFQGLGAGPEAIAASLLADLEALNRFGHVPLPAPSVLWSPATLERAPPSARARPGTPHEKSGPARASSSVPGELRASPRSGS